MSKILPKFIKIEPLIALGLSALLLIFAYVLKSTPETLTYTFRNGVIQKHSDHDFFQVIAGLTILLVVLLCFAGSIGCIAVWLRHKQKTAGKAALMWLTTIVCLVLILVASAVAGGQTDDKSYHPEYYPFSNGQHSIVIEEKSFLLGGFGTVYQVKKNGEAHVIGSFQTDDGGRNNGDYTIQWSDAYADITFHTFTDSGKTDTIRVKLT